MARLSDEDRDDLSAYLDGELDEAVAEALEARLANDPQARAEAESLRRTWELLDYLPRAEASTSFAHRTLERLAVQTGALTAQPAGPRRWMPWWLAAVGWAAAVVLAAGGGMTAANYLWPPEDPAEAEARAARHQRVIENRRLYEHVEDLEFLRDLDHPDLFGEDTGW